MIVTWIVMGLNKQARHIEINSYLSDFQVHVIAMLETRVKKTNADKIRNKLGNNSKYVDNYTDHENGGIQLMWNHNEVDVKALHIAYHYIHAEVYGLD